MQYQRFDHRYQLRFMSGERFIATLLDFCRREGIGYAALSGLGAVSSVDLAYFNDDTRVVSGWDAGAVMLVFPDSCPLRIRVSRSAMGSVIDIRSLRLPARLNHARDLPERGQVADLDAA